MITHDMRREAYDAVLPEANTRRQIILSVQRHSNGMTAEEIMDTFYRDGAIPYKDPNFVRPRLTELKSAGAVKVNGARKSERTGRRSAIWVYEEEKYESV